MTLTERFNVRMAKEPGDKYTRAAELLGTKPVDLMRQLLSEQADKILAAAEAADMMRRGDIAGATARFEALRAAEVAVSNDLQRDIAQTRDKALGGGEVAS